MTCPECGSTVPDSFAECPTCGTNLSTQAENATETCPHCSENIASGEDACPACGHLHIRIACANHADVDAEGQCVVCGSTLCKGCNQGGDTHFLCAAHCDIPVEQGWAQVYTTNDDLEAQLIRENLQAEGLDARVLSQKDHFAVPVDLGDLSPVRVLVPAYSYADAAELIASHTDRSGEVRFGEEPDEAPLA